MTVLGSAGIQVFSTCPQSKDCARDAYLQRVIDVAQWSEDVGCCGMLVYSDNGLVDPWLLSQIVIQNTTALIPLVAVQPVYQHPYAAAKMVATLGNLHGRRVCLNMIAGGFRNDLIALNDPTPHDERYERLVEYTLIIKELLAGSGPVTFEGKHYAVTKLRMTPPLPPDLFPRLFVSGSSPAGLAAAAAVGAVAVKYPKPPDAEEAAGGGDPAPGVRVGVIARDDAEEAWTVARGRFPETRRGQLTHQLSMKVSDSQWHQQLSEAAGPGGAAEPYWLGPFQNYQTFCPYLVGSYERVADALARYIRAGFKTFILDIPPTREELNHIATVFAKVAVVHE